MFTTATVSALWAYILAPVVTLCATKIGFDVWFKYDEQGEDRDRAFAELARQIKAVTGKDDSRIAQVFDDLAFDDYSDAIAEAYVFAELAIKRPEVVVEEFDKLFRSMLTKKLNDPAQRALIRQLANEAQEIQTPAA